MQDSDTGQAPTPFPPSDERILLIRLAVGLAQGWIAWALLTASSKSWVGAWLQSHPMTLSALLLGTTGVALIALAQVGRMRPAHLLPYLLLAGAALCALGAYDMWRHPVIETWSGRGSPRSFPSFSVILGAAVGLFIVNQLLEHRERGYKLFASYSAYVERAWMCMVQFLLAGLFAAMALSVLALGAGMFDMLGLHALAAQLVRPAIRYTLCSVAFALGVHLTDVRPALLLGVRNVLLVLMSWLLPLAVVLGWCFVAALSITTLQPLWTTHRAAWMLLWAAAGTLLLINAAYRDGRHERAPALAIAWAGRAAGPLLLALGMLAAYAMFLRVGAHGWTPERIRAAAVGAVTLLYGVGYTWAALRPGPWLRTLEPVNIGASLLMLALLVGLLTPLADPSRLAVNSQVARLRAGKVSAQTFDFAFLRSGRYGRQALEQLGKSRDAQVASLALKAGRDESLDDSSPSTTAPRSKPVHEPRPDPATEPALSHARIYPPGAKLPASFRNMPWRNLNALDIDCMFDGTACEIYTLLPKGGVPTYILISTSANSRRSDGPLFAPSGHGKWYRIGMVKGLDCPGVREALRAGRARAVPPLLDDLLVANQRILVRTFVGFRSCDVPFEELDVGSDRPPDPRAR